jgi:hypothetical protein
MSEIHKLICNYCSSEKVIPSYPNLIHTDGVQWFPPNYKTHKDWIRILDLDFCDTCYVQIFKPFLETLLRK